MTPTQTRASGIANSLKWDLAKSVAKLNQLSEVLAPVKGRRMLVLCHNNPDPDSIGGAYAFSFLLAKKFGIRSVLGYGGVVTRAENKAMIHRLRIKMMQLTKVDPSKYGGIALIDAQPGTGNNLMDARKPSPLIVVDHHPLRQTTLKAPFHDIRTRYGATSTIITEYLVAAGLIPLRSVANALLYGIKADTNSLTRAAAKVDFTAFNYLSPLTNHRIIGLIERPALSSEYFEDLYNGISKTIIYRDVAISDLGEIHSEAIVPELADLLLRTEGVSWSFCIGKMDKLLILSMRSTTRTHKAGYVLRRLVAGQGSAGGHREMAGGQVPLTGKSPQEKKELPSKLIASFLKLIKRERCQPKPFVHTDAKCKAAE
ncbi:DHH family phosphoesterase [Desulfomonile tiedjei]|uniref:DHH family phosphoesterase n=1 Tax=Desulfomonile tiedjei TaxID=2358 RepID=UPI0002DD8A77|nr:bifunctional oligoribonuclease/PAP phosphatase NrnA [Desulfomonile tiedjei]